MNEYTKRTPNGISQLQRCRECQHNDKCTEIPINPYHKCTETMRGHVFCSFLALCLRKDLTDRLASKGSKLEWNDIVRDLNELQEMQTVFSGKPFALRSQLKGCAHKVLQAVGVAVPATVREA